MASPRNDLTLKKPIAILLSLCLLWTSGNLAEASLYIPNLQSHAPYLPQFELVPPPSLGRIVDYHNSPTPALVILIQDLHAHYGVQKNIAALLDFLADKLSNRRTGETQKATFPPSPTRRNADTIPFALAVEGAAGPIDSSVMALFPDKKLKQEACDYLMREGQLSGMEYFAAMHNQPQLLVGVEDEKYYNIHRDIFRKNLESRTQLVQALTDIQADISSLRPQVYSRTLKAFQEKLDAFEAGTLRTEDYISYLVAQARFHDVELKSDFPTLHAFGQSLTDPAESSSVVIRVENWVKGLRGGDRLTREQLRAYTASFLNKAYGYLSTDERQILGTLAKQPHLNSYYFYLRDLIYNHQLFSAVPPELARYLEYLHAIQSINMDRILHEAKELAFRIKLQRAQSDAEKDLTQVEHDLGLLLRMADLQATELEVRTFGPRLNQFMALCHALLASNGIRTFDETRVRQLISSSIDYYVMAYMRNRPMVENTLTLLKGNRESEKRGSGEKAKRRIRTVFRPHNGEVTPSIASSAPESYKGTAVLVTGGFHTSSITQLLREKNVSYVVITPTLDKATKADHDLYIKRLSGVLLSTEEILASAYGSPLQPGRTTPTWMPGHSGLGFIVTAVIVAGLFLTTAEAFGAIHQGVSPDLFLPKFTEALVYPDPIQQAVIHPWHDQMAAYFAKPKTQELLRYLGGALASGALILGMQGPNGPKKPAVSPVRLTFSESQPAIRQNRIQKFIEGTLGANIQPDVLDGILLEIDNHKKDVETRTDIEVLRELAETLSKKASSGTVFFWGPRVYTLVYPDFNKTGWVASYRFQQEPSNAYLPTRKNQAFAHVTIGLLLLLKAKAPEPQSAVIVSSPEDAPVSGLIYPTTSPGRLADSEDFIQDLEKKKIPALQGIPPVGLIIDLGTGANDPKAPAITTRELRQKIDPSVPIVAIDYKTDELERRLANHTNESPSFFAPNLFFVKGEIFFTDSLLEQVTSAEGKARNDLTGQLLPSIPHPHRTILFRGSNIFLLYTPRGVDWLKDRAKELAAYPVMVLKEKSILYKPAGQKNWNKIGKLASIDGREPEEKRPAYTISEKPLLTHPKTYTAGEILQRLGIRKFLRWWLTRSESVRRQIEQEARDKAPQTSEAIEAEKQWIREWFAPAWEIFKVFSSKFLPDHDPIVLPAEYDRFTPEEQKAMIAALEQERAMARRGIIHISIAGAIAGLALAGWLLFGAFPGDLGLNWGTVLRSVVVPLSGFLVGAVGSYIYHHRFNKGNRLNPLTKERKEGLESPLPEQARAKDDLTQIEEIMWNTLRAERATDRKLADEMAKLRGYPSIDVLEAIAEGKTIKTSNEVQFPTALDSIVSILKMFKVDHIEKEPKIKASGSLQAELLNPSFHYQTLDHDAMSAKLDPDARWVLTALVQLLGYGYHGFPEFFGDISRLKEFRSRNHPLFQAPSKIMVKGEDWPPPIFKEKDYPAIAKARFPKTKVIPRAGTLSIAPSGLPDTPYFEEAAWVVDKSHGLAVQTWRDENHNVYVRLFEITTQSMKALTPPMRVNQFVQSRKKERTTGFNQRVTFKKDSETGNWNLVDGEYQGDFAVGVYAYDLDAVGKPKTSVLWAAENRMTNTELEVYYFPHFDKDQEAMRTMDPYFLPPRGLDNRDRSPNALSTRLTTKVGRGILRTIEFFAYTYNSKQLDTPFKDYRPWTGEGWERRVQNWIAPLESYLVYFPQFLRWHDSPTLSEKEQGFSELAKQKIIELRTQERQTAIRAFRYITALGFFAAFALAAWGLGLNLGDLGWNSNTGISLAAATVGGMIAHYPYHHQFNRTHEYNPLDLNPNALRQLNTWEIAGGTSVAGGLSFAALSASGFVAALLAIAAGVVLILTTVRHKQVNPGSQDLSVLMKRMRKDGVGPTLRDILGIAAKTKGHHLYMADKTLPAGSEVNEATQTILGPENRAVQGAA